MGLANELYSEAERNIDNILLSENKHVIHSLLVINIDDLYRLNEKLGVEETDAILNMISEIIKNFFKGTDIVAQINLGEYAILIQNPKSVNDIEKICDRMLKHISEISFNGVSVSCSIGIAVYPFHGKSYASLKTNAYQALMRAKSNGKNCYRVFEAALTKARFSNYIFNGDYEDFDYRNLNEDAWDKYFMEVSLQLFHYDSNIYSCLNSLLEIFCLYHGFNRAFILTNQNHDLYDKKRLSFSMPGYELPSNEYLDLIRNDLVTRLYEEKGKYGVVRTNKPSEDVEIMNYMNDTNVSEILFFSLLSDGDFYGGIVFENTNDDYSKVQPYELMKISRQIDSILMYALLSMNYRGSKELFSKIEMFEGMGACVYIIDSTSYSIEYMNEKAIMACENNFVGRKCYDVIANGNCVCDQCPLNLMDVDNTKANCRKDCLNHSTGKWSTNLYSWLSGRDNKGKVLLISIDSDNVFDVLGE